MERTIRDWRVNIVLGMRGGERLAIAAGDSFALFFGLYTQSCSHNIDR
jgi:hypothetical protein